MDFKKNPPEKFKKADEVKKKDVRPGDEVCIERAGDVIPEVVERVKTPGKKRSAAFHMPETCPACGADVYREGAYYLCPAGLSCQPQLVDRIMYLPIMWWPAKIPARNSTMQGRKMLKSSMKQNSNRY